jgi:hypothetical protein
MTPAPPPSPPLTAYGLLEFLDMRRVYPVDDALLARTASWLLGRRDGKGGFLHGPRGWDAFGHAGVEAADAYITWALAEAGRGAELGRELDEQRRRGRASDDPYLVARSSEAEPEHHDRAR